MDLICCFYKNMLRDTYQTIGKIEDYAGGFGEINMFGSSFYQQEGKQGISKYGSFYKMHNPGEQPFLDYLRFQVRQHDDSN